MQVWLSILMDDQHFHYNRKMKNNNCYTCYYIMLPNHDLKKEFFKFLI